MTDVAVTVPCFGERDPSMVRALYGDALPEYRLHIAFYPSTQDVTAVQATSFARNQAASLSADVLVFNDADSLVDPERIREAVALAAAAPGLVFAFTHYLRLSQRATEALGSWRDAFEAPAEWEMYGSCSAGCIAIRRECFLEVGGFDVSWRGGYEDLDFANRCAERWPLRRVDGELVHLWHPRTVEPEASSDRERYEKRWGWATSPA